MSIKKYHVSKQLFDKTNADVKNSTSLSDQNTWASGGTGAVIRIPCEANTQYTFAINGYTGTIWRLSLCASDNVPPPSVTVNDITKSVPSTNATTFTTNADTKYILFQGSVAIINTIIDTIMLNTGSTAEPYEPYDPEVWHEIPYKRYETSTDTITTLPTELIADSVSAYTIKGNMQQSGTPTPASPIQPQEVGVRTENLFDKDRTDTNNGYVADNYLRPYDGNVGSGSSNHIISEYIDISAYSQLTLSGVGISSSTANSFYDENKSLLSYFLVDEVPKTVNVPQNAKYIRLTVYKPRLGEEMLNGGSTALPYEPYGYKIPISSGGVTTNLYLGDVQSTRQIKKLVLDGTETWRRNDNNSVYYTSFTGMVYTSGIITTLCTHYEAQENVTSYAQMTDKCTCMRADGTSFALWIKDESITSIDDFKAYLAAQYTAGTPVIVWYVLDTAETVTLNEPLRKIGDYVDSISGSTIPTTGTAEQFDVLTDLKPSEVSLTYTGWHSKWDKKYEEGTNLLTNTEFTSTTTDTRTFLNLFFVIQQGSSAVTRVTERIEQTGVYTLILVSTGVGERVVVKHSGQTRDVVIADVVIPVQEGDTFVFTANFTGIDPTVEGGIVSTNMSLTNPKWE